MTKHTLQSMSPHLLILSPVLSSCTPCTFSTLIFLSHVFSPHCNPLVTSFSLHLRSFTPPYWSVVLLCCVTTPAASRRLVGKHAQWHVQRRHGGSEGDPSAHSRPRQARWHRRAVHQGNQDDSAAFAPKHPSVRGMSVCVCVCECVSV